MRGLTPTLGSNGVVGIVGMRIEIGGHPGRGTTTGGKGCPSGGFLIKQPPEDGSNHGGLVLVGSASDLERAHDAGSTSSISVPARSLG
jgi:hypothetical protein